MNVGWRVSRRREKVVRGGLVGVWWMRLVGVVCGDGDEWLAINQSNKLKRKQSIGTHLSTPRPKSAEQYQPHKMADTAAVSAGG